MGRLGDVLPIRDALSRKIAHGWEDEGRAIAKQFPNAGFNWLIAEIFQMVTADMVPFIYFQF